MFVRPALPVVLAAAAFGQAVPVRADEIYTPYAAVSLEESWDSNVLGSRGDDAVTRLTPRAGLLTEGRRLVLSLDYRVGLHSYLAGTADDTINHRGSAFARFAVDARSDLEANALVVQADDPIVLDRPGVAVPPGGIFEVQTGLKLTTQLTRRLQTQASYAYRLSRFDLADDPMPLAYDGDEHRTDLKASYRLTRRFDATVAGRGQYFVSGGMQPDEVAAAPLGGLAWRATRKLIFSAQSGPVFYIPRGDGASEISYLADGRAVWAGKRVRAALVALRELYGGTGTARAIWSEQVGGSVAWQLARLVVLRGSGGLGRQGPAPDGPADASTLTGRAELRLGLGRQLRLDLFAEHRTQDAEGGIAFGDVQRTVAGVRLIGVLGTDFESLAEVP
jgi:hypothetical protein